MSAFDVIIRNGLVVTASDSTMCDVGIKHGRVAALARHLTDGTTIIDAAGKYFQAASMRTCIWTSRRSMGCF